MWRKCPRDNLGISHVKLFRGLSFSPQLVMVLHCCLSPSGQNTYVFTAGLVMTTEYTEWQRPLSGVHSIMMEKFAQAGEGGGCTVRPPSFTISTSTYKVVVFAPSFYFTLICTLLSWRDIHEDGSGSSLLVIMTFGFLCYSTKLAHFLCFWAATAIFLPCNSAPAVHYLTKYRTYTVFDYILLYCSWFKALIHISSFLLLKKILRGIPLCQAS